MVVCRFFQQGYCRYGQNCRFEHIYGSKYTYHANQAQPAAPQPAGCTDEQLVNQVQADVQSALRGGQWILSCYSPFKEKPIFPGISDLSPEEARLFIYEAESNKTIDQAVAYMNNLFKEARQKYEQLLQPNVNIIKVLRSLYKGEITESPFTNIGQNSFGSSNTQQSIFNTQPDPAKELFSKANNTSIFGQSAAAQNQNSTAKSIFASAVQNTNNQTSPSNIFSSANKSIFGSPPTQNASPFGQPQNTSPFGQPQNNCPFGQPQNNSPFGQAQHNSPFGQPQNTSPFGQSQNNAPFGQAQNSLPFGQPQNSSPFGQPQNSSPFGQAQNNSPIGQSQNTSPFAQGNVFQKSENPASIFGQANRQFNTTSEPGVYSKMEEIPEADLEAFKSDRFELGFVPELSPPIELCNPGL